MATPHTVTLTWTPASDADAATTYNVYRSVTSGSESVKINTSLVVGNSFTDPNPAIGVDFYVVRAVEGGVESANSVEVSVTVQLPTPNPPTNLVAKVN